MSATAWGLGLVGSITCLALIMPLMRGGFDEQNTDSYRLVFPVNALFFALLGLAAVRRPESSLVGAGVGAAYRDVMVTLAGRLSAIVGPLLSGVVSTATRSQQAAVLSLLVFLVLGAWVLNGMRTEIAAACD